MRIIFVRFSVTSTKYEIKLKYQMNSSAPWVYRFIDYIHPFLRTWLEESRTPPFPRITSYWPWQACGRMNIVDTIFSFNLRHLINYPIYNCCFPSAVAVWEDSAVKGIRWCSSSPFFIADFKPPKR